MESEERQLDSRRLKRNGKEAGSRKFAERCKNVAVGIRNCDARDGRRRRRNDWRNQTVLKVLLAALHRACGAISPVRMMTLHLLGLCTVMAVGLTAHAAAPGVVGVRSACHQSQRRGEQSEDHENGFGALHGNTLTHSGPRMKQGSLHWEKLGGNLESSCYHSS